MRRQPATVRFVECGRGHCPPSSNQLEAKVATAESRIGRLAQSSLAKDVRCELVSQDPNDEPASPLL
ncbi:hypothetical protein D3C84_1055400 [compost metagenome]